MSVLVASRVRQNAASAGIPALLMVYFGFLALARPAGPGLFNWAALAFYCTLRIGGVLMALTAVWSLTGRRSVLLVDGVVSIAIGALFVLSAMGMLIDGGGAFTSGLYVVFGIMFISSGVRNWHEFFNLARLTERLPGPDAGYARSGDLAGPPRPTAVSAGPTSPLVAQPGQATELTCGTAQPTAGTAASVPDEDAPILWPEAGDGESFDVQEEPAGDGESEGFLASFGDEEPPPRI